jgi:hypothetical protein
MNNRWINYIPDSVKEVVSKEDYLNIAIERCPINKKSNVALKEAFS